MRGLPGGVAVCLALAFAVGPAGCKPVPPPVALAEGVVTYDGQPVPTGTVSFLTADDQPVGGAAVLDGKYRVYPEVGLAPGRYKVKIAWPKATGEKRQVGYGQSPDVFAEGLPDKYNTATTLTADLAAGPNGVDFKLDK